MSSTLSTPLPVTIRHSFFNPHSTHISLLRLTSSLHLLCTAPAASLSSHHLSLASASTTTSCLCTFYLLLIRLHRLTPPGALSLSRPSSLTFPFRLLPLAASSCDESFTARYCSFFLHLLLLLFIYSHSPQFECGVWCTRSSSRCEHERPSQCEWQ